MVGAFFGLLVFNCHDGSFGFFHDLAFKENEEKEGYHFAGNALA